MLIGETNPGRYNPLAREIVALRFAQPVPG